MASNCHVKVNPEMSMCQPHQNGVAEFRESLKEHTTPCYGHILWVTRTEALPMGCTTASLATMELPADLSPQTYAMV